MLTIEEGTIYAIQAHGTSWVKIGYTSGNVQQRLSALQIGSPLMLTVIATVTGAGITAAIEHSVHVELATHKMQGEWFDIGMNQAMLDALVATAVQQSATSATQTLPGEEECDQIVIQVDRDDLREFRAECLRRGTTPKKELAYLLKQRMKEAW